MMRTMGALALVSAMISTAAYANDPPICWDGSTAKGVWTCVTLPPLPLITPPPVCGWTAPWKCPRHIIVPKHVLGLAEQLQSSDSGRGLTTGNKVSSH